jgi:hypothetical protein
MLRKVPHYWCNWLDKLYVCLFVSIIKMFKKNDPRPLRWRHYVSTQVLIIQRCEVADHQLLPKL